jgi:hypothetical protein
MKFDTTAEIVCRPRVIRDGTQVSASSSRTAGVSVINPRPSGAIFACGRRHDKDTLHRLCTCVQERTCSQFGSRFFLLLVQPYQCLCNARFITREAFIGSRCYVADGSERGDLSQDDVNRDGCKRKNTTCCGGVSRQTVLTTLY